MRAFNNLYRANEPELVKTLLAQNPFDVADIKTIQANAKNMVQTLRDAPQTRTLLEDFMQRFALNTAEGVALMQLAESLLRVPDAPTADQLLQDKLHSADWHKAGDAQKWLTQFAGWGLRVVDNILDYAAADGVLNGLVQRLSLPVFRLATGQAIQILAGQFVLGQDIASAIDNAQKQGFRASFDMLGEGARDTETAERYFAAYQQAIAAIGQSALVRGHDNMFERAGISIKLSALHPRYEELGKAHCFDALVDKVWALAQQAADVGINLTLDAEEAHRLELSLDIFEAVYQKLSTTDYCGFGLAVQAYQKRGVGVIDHLLGLAKTHGRLIPIRLVKGAYWDSEIKRAQEKGLSDYPVFTRKTATDVAYMVCAAKMLAQPDLCYGQFATHNAFTITAIQQLAAKNNTPFEFQRLHGMGQPLYNVLPVDMPCRVYAPVGAYQDLLPYLVRRLLENGANSSFVHQVHDVSVPLDNVVCNPFELLPTLPYNVPLPKDLFGAERPNIVAPDLSDRAVYAPLQQAVSQKLDVAMPANTQASDIPQIMAQAQNAFDVWHQTSLAQRVACVQKLAEKLVAERDVLLQFLVQEAYKTIDDAVAEWREATDFCYYYAMQALAQGAPQNLVSPTGETNVLTLEGRGVFAAISPWNFPLAIYVGQIVAALLMGNSVVAKPAPQTPRIAALVQRWWTEICGTQHTWQLVLGGADVGQALVAAPEIAGVVFTGSTSVAQNINQTLAAKNGPIVPLIAETGGQNAMIVDSSALAEQAVDDIVRSAFYTAGQRCSALRVLFMQNDVAEHVLHLLAGAMQTLRVGDNTNFATDIGRVIDAPAMQRLHAHRTWLETEGYQHIASVPVPENYFAPTAFEIPNISVLKGEVFGPILHVVRFDIADLAQVLADIKATGFGLTLGLHTRLQSRVDYVAAAARVGNIYVNRSITGAVVGVQPFGGMGLSGTGPKAGGPHYLQRFATEKTLSINTTAAGGNAALLAGV